MSVLRLEPVPFDEAIAHARGRKVVLPDEYYGSMQGVARAESFSVAGLARLDQVDAVRSSLQQALENGETFSAWKDRVRRGEILLDLPDYRLETIFRTNVQGAYARGRCVQHDTIADRRPFLLYSAVNDSRTRPAHTAMNGTILHRDDPFWRTNRPPNGYNCRCTVIAITPAQAAKRGGTKLPDPDPSTGQLPEPDSGWGYDVCGNPRAGSKAAITKAMASRGVEDAAFLKDIQKKADSFDPATWRALPGSQRGATPGGVYEAPDGARHYVKFHDDKGQSYTEVAAARIYERFGVSTLKPRVIVVDGQTGVATDWVDGLRKLSLEQFEEHVDDVARAYNASVVINNRDFVGVESGGLMLGPHGRLVLVDSSGSFKYQPRGKLKEFGRSIAEMDSLFDRSKNPQSAGVLDAVFSKDPLAGEKVASLLSRVDAAELRTDLLVSGLPPSDVDEFVNILSSRRDALLRKYDL